VALNDLASATPRAFSEDDYFHSSSNLKRGGWVGVRVKKCPGANGVMGETERQAPAACLQRGIY
jgi:hypothetical protein